jgi:phosphoribosylformylglycinamidine synthase
MKIGVRVLPKPEVLDSQGRAVEKTLIQHRYNVGAVRVGKFIVLDIPEQAKETALVKAKEIAEFVLHNPLTETFELEVLG